jgi:5'-3' exonuclease
MSLVTPTEEVEQRLVVEYCRLKNYDFWHTPNETYTKSWNQKRKNKEMGVVKGIPDLFIIINNKLIAIEMKRTKGSVTSKEQTAWIEKLNLANIPAKVCKGAEEAIKFINNIKETI